MKRTLEIEQLFFFLHVYLKYHATFPRQEASDLYLTEIPPGGLVDVRVPEVMILVALAVGVAERGVGEVVVVGDAAEAPDVRAPGRVAAEAHGVRVVGRHDDQGLLEWKRRVFERADGWDNCQGSLWLSLTYIAWPVILFAYVQ